MSKPIMESCRPMCREGCPFLLIALALALAVGALTHWIVGGVFLLLPAYVFYFFRNPDRTVPDIDSAVISPADGTVIDVSEVAESRFLHKKCKKVSIFMSLVSVHVNRIPATGRIKSVHYNEGKFLIGWAEKASLDNEQNAIIMETKSGDEIMFVQIAGFVARRIVCYVKGGEEVTRGERFGLIRFGSRVDVYLPLTCTIEVEKGQKVAGGESILARCGAA